MRHICLLFAILIISACSKDNIGPMGLKHNQVVEVFVDHRYGAINDQTLLLPEMQQSAYSLYGFDDREAGYTYRIRAKVHLDKSDPPIQDAPPYWLDFLEIVTKEKYEGNDPFEIALIQSLVPDGPVIMLWEVEGQYYFIPEKLTLTAASEEVREQLEEIWQYKKENFLYANRPASVPEWKAIQATVTHDPENFGKSYLVSQITFEE